MMINVEDEYLDDHVVEHNEEEEDVEGDLNSISHI
jgi:hypothetical protein